MDMLLTSWVSGASQKHLIYLFFIVELIPPIFFLNEHIKKQQVAWQFLKRFEKGEMPLLCEFTKKGII